MCEQGDIFDGISGTLLAQVTPNLAKGDGNTQRIGIWDGGKGRKDTGRKIGDRNRQGADHPEDSRPLAGGNPAVWFTSAAVELSAWSTSLVS